MISDLNFDKLCRRNVPLSNYSSYDVGGNADFFAVPENVEELSCILEHCKECGLYYFIFGHGTNILFPDNPKKGKVFISLKRFTYFKTNNSTVFFSAGVPLSLLSLIGVISADTRFDFTFLLPGSLGAGIYINAKCYDYQVSEIIQTVYYMDMAESDFSIKSIKVEECDFGYKTSIFQNKPWIIIGADLHILNLKDNVTEYITGLFNRIRDDNTNLSSLPSFYTLFVSESNNLHNTPEKFKEILEYRNSKCHFNYPSCGSVFKNNYSFGTPMGAIIEKLNLRGKQCGGAMISPYHGNIIINYNNAKSCDIITLIELIKEQVYKTYGFIPQSEVVIIND